MKDLIGQDVPLDQTMILRRLWYEAHLRALVDLEARASRASDAPPRQVPLAERLTRPKSRKVEG